MAYAQISDDVIVNLVAADAGFAAAAGLVEVPDTAQIGWVLVEDAWQPPSPPPVSADDLYAYAAARRYEVETGGITIEGMAVMTDRGSQALITGAYSYVQANPDVTVKFKTASGFVELTAEQMTAIANAVGGHVQAAFAAEATIAAAIAAGTVTTTDEIDAADWPEA